ncbi:BadF/BadG/BcrA/BcrD ATPase family protein [Devosia sp. SD17-2]|uniref:N-acetylglucosamine kinase n=1 Tax=Devosia sp. SD17-2 TaxID=2976459 RepID=UPI0023D80679|nr:BadF/BadG/BcrA/BcrD ATPase family protein [Devosia sp. SD17-2]WEJ35073.1 hypothetical protein NYQ88_09895 [Devosia sp. SD17-2]
MTIVPAQRPACIGIDIGGTGSRWVACDVQGRELARGLSKGATAHIFNVTERQRLETVLADINVQLATHGILPSRIRAGLTGYGKGVEEAAKILFSDAFGVQADLFDDITAAYLAVFRPGEGHVISAGTGSFGIHISADGTQVRVGGRGILVDDAGSGSWIALRAVECLYRIHDRDGNFDAMPFLAHQIFVTVGATEWDNVREFIYSGDRGRIGTLAVAVSRAAHDGELYAMELLSRAGRELAKIATNLTMRIGPSPLAFIGGALDLHPNIKKAIDATLSGRDISFPRPDAALAAAQQI